MTMKCDDVFRLLDERQLTELGPAETTELEAHLSRCPECARQCLASELAASFRTDAPEMPASLEERARRLHAACQSAAPPQVARRPFIVGGLLLLGCAATMYAAVPRLDPQPVRQ